MKPTLRCVGMIVPFVVMVFAFSAIAQEQLPEAFAVEDIPLISLESRIEWGADWEWTRAIEAATILGWFHAHGYPALLDDLNGDGVIDELDIIELADRLGKHEMGTDAAQPMSDPWLVHGLATYVAERYPDEFVLKLYDLGLAVEYEVVYGEPLELDTIPGILLILKEDPTIGAYMEELVEEEGVIVGVQDVENRNHYLTGRSFQREPIAPNTFAVDLAWAQEDFWTPGTQGQVLKTRAVQDERLRVEYLGGLKLTEFMLALSPRAQWEDGLEGGDCPDLVIASSEACVCERDTCAVTVDVTVMNIGAADVPGGFTVLLTGVMCAGVPLPGASQVAAVSGAMVDTLNTTGSVSLSFTYTFPHTAAEAPCCRYVIVVDSGGDIDESCHPAPRGEYNNVDTNRFCCDEIPEPCPDLVVSGSAECELIGVDGGWLAVITIRAHVSNIGTAPVTSIFRLGYGLWGYGSSTIPVGNLPELNTTGSTDVDIHILIPITDPSEACFRYGLAVDVYNDVDESCHPFPAGEHNNHFVAHSPFCCDDTVLGECPDLHVVGSAICECRESDLGPRCFVTVQATAINTGADVTGPVWVRLWEYPLGGGAPFSVAQEISPAAMNAAGAVTIFFTYSFAPVPGEPPCREYYLMVDPGNGIDETCVPDGEDNNRYPDGSDMAVVCCEGTQDCPDLVTAIQQISCTCRAAPGAPEGTCTITVQAVVTNVGGGEVPSSFPVTASAGCFDAPASQTLYVGPGAINPTGSASLTFSLSGVLDPLSPCCVVTVDANSNGGFEECPDDFPDIAVAEVCCEDAQACLDLAIRGEAACECTEDPPAGAALSEPTCTKAIDATVTKLSGGVIPVPVGVSLSELVCDGVPYASPLVMIDGADLDTLNTTGSVTVSVYHMVDLSPQAECCEYTLTVGAGLEECPDSEENNTFHGTFCCEPAEGCPDLVGEIIRCSCDCEPPYTTREWVQTGLGPTGKPIFEWVVTEHPGRCDVRLTVEVTNVGDVAAGPFWMEAEETTYGDSGMAHVDSLGFMEAKQRWIDIEIVEDVAISTLTFELTVDSGGAVDESCTEGGEANNTSEEDCRCR